VQKFKNQQLIQILEFQFYFWSKPSDTPSFYSFMNYADFGLGTLKPEFDLVRAMKVLQKS
jgi:phytoene desaturase